MSHDFDIVVVGGCNFDYLIRGPKLPSAGETVDGSEFQEAPGGKGANQAIAAARLGTRVSMIAKIGSDARGDLCLQALSREGVDVTAVERDEQSNTGVALVLVEQSGRKQIMAAPGANHRLTVKDIESQRMRLSNAKVALAQLEVPLETVLMAFQICRQRGGRTVLDPAPAAPIPDELLKVVNVIRPNALEAETLTGIRVRERHSALQAAQQLLDRGVEAAIVQAGDDGDLAVWNGGEQWLPRLPVKSVDATGAGDAFAAALAVQLAEGRSVGEAAIFANAASALATTKVGAQAGLPDRAAVEELLKKMRTATGG